MRLAFSAIFGRVRESSGTLRRPAARGSSLIFRILNATGVGAGPRAHCKRLPRVADREAPPFRRKLYVARHVWRVSRAFVVFIGNASVSVPLGRVAQWLRGSSHRSSILGNRIQRLNHIQNKSRARQHRYAASRASKYRSSAGIEFNRYSEYSRIHNRADRAMSRSSE